MWKDRYLIVKCENEECFSDISKPVPCDNCSEGELYSKCYNCGKETLIKDSSWSKIVCGCVASGLEKMAIEKL
jgi:ribosomal protein S27E